MSSPFSPPSWTSAGRCQSQKSENCLLGPQGACSAGGRDVGRCRRVCLGPCSSLIFPQTGKGWGGRGRGFWGNCDLGPCAMLGPSDYLSIYLSIPSRFFLAGASFVQTGCDLGLCSAGSIELSVYPSRSVSPVQRLRLMTGVGSIEFPVYPSSSVSLAVQTGCDLGLCSVGSIELSVYPSRSVSIRLRFVLTGRRWGGVGRGGRW